MNKSVYRRVRLNLADPVVLLTLHSGGEDRGVAIVRDLEVHRAAKNLPGYEVHSYEAFTPEGGLSGDREVRAAQSLAECLRRHGVASVVSDRSLPLLYAHFMRAAGVGVACDETLGVADRRRKDAFEREAMARAQRVTEGVIRRACEMIARADTRDDGTLIDPDDASAALTSEAVMRRIDLWLMDEGCVADVHIVAGGTEGEDCHNRGAGPLRSGEPVIVDVFPMDKRSLYHGDCTRTVVHGKVTDEVRSMHEAVAEAKAAAIGVMRAGVTGEAAHRAAAEVITGRGYHMGFPPEGAGRGYASMPHGLGHGLGLSLKEPPLLDIGGPELIEGDIVTVEPGLYMLGVGGIRLEDMVVVRNDGCENLNTLHEGLDWA